MHNEKLPAGLEHGDRVCKECPGAEPAQCSDRPRSEKQDKERDTESGLRAWRDRLERFHYPRPIEWAEYGALPMREAETRAPCRCASPAGEDRHRCKTRRLATAVTG